MWYISKIEKGRIYYLSYNVVTGIREFSNTLINPMIFTSIEKAQNYIKNHFDGSADFRVNKFENWVY